MKKPAFTLLEVVFVIIILGIVSSIAATVIAKIYENYLVQRSIHNISVKTELAAEQILNRLQYSIPSLIVAREPGNFTNVRELELIPSGDTTRTILEWIAYDNDSFSATARPGWSGYADLNTSIATLGLKSIRTPGSDLNMTDTIMRNLSRNRVSTSIAANRPNLIFSISQYSSALGVDILYNPMCMGLDGAAADFTCASPFTTTSFVDGHDRINFNNTPFFHAEFYKVSWSAYALVPTNAGGGSFDLVLHSNYQPWLGNDYSTDGMANTLIKNVTSFKFLENAGTLRFKLCAREAIVNTDSFISACKEKVIIR